MPKHRALGMMGARKIPEARQELSRDLATGEAERTLEEPHPFVHVERMVSLEPGIEGTVIAAQLDDFPCIPDSGLDLEAVADDPVVLEKARFVARAVGGHPVHVEPVEGVTESFPLLQDGEPAESGLIDLETEPFEQHPLVAARKAIFPVVIRPVPGMAGRHGTIGLREGHGLVHGAEGPAAIGDGTR